MKASKDQTILALDRAIRAPEVKRYVDAALDRTSRALPQSDRAMTWEVVPLDIFPDLPPEIQSCWVFSLGPFQNSGAERHPNSHQRSLCLKGDGEYQVRTNARWETTAVRAAARALDERWASIPQGAWHQWVVGPHELAVLSFHTIVADQLIEERPNAHEALDAGATTQHRYHDRG